MVDFDQETWIYLGLILFALLFLLWNSQGAGKAQKMKKNKNFRKRYLERKKQKETNIR